MQLDFKIGIWNAWIFMSVFLLQMIAMIFINKQVFERSHIPSELNRNILDKNASILGNVVWLLAMVYSVFLPFQLGTFLFYIGLAVFIAGLIFITVATYDFITTPVDQLITKGVYKISRHPMYFATFLICISSTIATKSLPFSFLTLIMALCFYHEASIEEKYCLNKYGSAYQEYKKQTPKLIGIPGISK